MVYSSDKLTEHETYTLLINGIKKQTVEMAQKQVTLGDRAPGFGGRPEDFGGSAGKNGGRRVPGADSFKDSNLSQNNPIQVILNGSRLTFDTSPILVNNTTLVPLRTIFEALGMEIDWDEATQTVTAQKDGITLTLTIGSTEASKNGESIFLLTAPQLSIEGRTLVPIRFIAESLGLNVTWIDATRTVIITQ